MPMTTAQVGSDKDLRRHSQTSAANTALAMSVGMQGGRRVVLVTVKYSAAPTQAGVTTAIDSGAGAAFDATLDTGSANAQSTVYQPVGGHPLGNDDALLVTAPAGGSGITASIAVYTEKL